MKKIRLFFVLFVLLLLTKASFSQLQFQKYYHFSDNYGIIETRQTSDSGFICIGTTFLDVLGDWRPVIMKTDKNGTVQWTKTLGDGYGKSIVLTPEGDYVMLAGFGCEILKTDQNGNFLWKKRLINSTFIEATAIEKTNDYGFIITGFSKPQSNRDIFLLKTDSSGNMEWAKIFPDGIGYSVQQTPDNGYIVCGDRFSDAFLLKTDSLGSIIWEKFYDHSADLSDCTAKPTADGGFIITGNSGSSTEKLILIKTDSLGSVQWGNNYIGLTTSSDIGRDVIQLDNGDFVIASQLTTSITGLQSCLTKIDNTGNVIWTKGYDSNNSTGLFVLQTNDKGFIMCAGANGLSFDQFVLLVKTDSLGNSGCNQNDVALIPIPALLQTTDITQVDSSDGVTIDTTTVISAITLSDNTVCSIVHVDEYALENSLTVSPNPSDGYFKINFGHSIQNGVIEMVDLAGKKFYESKINNQQEMEISTPNISKGFYFLKIMNEDKTIFKKIIVNE